MTIRPQRPGGQADGSLTVLTLSAAVALLLGLALLPGQVVFLGIVAATTALGLNLADLRRHGGSGLPRLPLRPEH